MKIVLVATGIVFVTTLSFVSVCAQSPMPAPPFGPTHVGGEERPDAPTSADFRRLPHPRIQFGPVTEKRVLKKGLLAPSAQDITANSTFLQQPDTGLIKLLPLERTTDRKTKGVKIRG